MPRPDDDTRLEAVVDLIVELASGNLTARLPPSPARDTIDAVVVGINLLAAELQDIYNDLETRVAERTYQLEQARASLELLALRDPLTGLANRNLLNDELMTAVRRSNGAGAPAVLLIDLDQFKTVNDSLGHGAGDAVLIEVARRLQALAWPGSTVARMGGDEFAILMPGASQDQALTFAAQTLKALNTPFIVDGLTVNAGASVGLRLGDAESTGELLLRDADTAMYVAKAEGRGNVQVYQPAMHNAVHERLTIASGLAEAIRSGQLFLVYQPIVGLPDSNMIGAEALVRWRHPVRGVLPPDDFIPIAESVGLIVEVGRWVIREAIAQIARWQRRPSMPDPFRLHINLSPLELRRSDLDAYILRTLADFEVAPALLVVELSETALMTSSPVGMNTLENLRSNGVRIAIDDFGTGYSSIGSLLRLPIDLVKLDRSLIAGIDTGLRQRNFLEAVLHLVRSVGLPAVAEGIETIDQQRVLIELGASYAQGFLFGVPTEPDALLTTTNRPARIGAADASDW